MTTGNASKHPGFLLDAFQRQAITAIDEGRSVVVAAPTGAGKTVVAEHAVRVALGRGRKAFYTTPIKALSNQKYHDLSREHGSGRVGLLTGDNSLNGEAPVVVMTTEVLRNMLYARGSLLDRLSYVVLDEVHYLEDPYRGSVWEEVIIHLPAQIGLVCLSATVSNSEELASWVSLVRGPTELVVEHTRPVELVHEYLLEDRSTGALRLIPTLVDGRPNPEGERLDPDTGSGRPRGPGARRPRGRWVTPRRIDVIRLLEQRGLLPAIYFLFSRAGCDEAARACLNGGLRLTSPEEEDSIAEIAERHLGMLSEADLGVLGHAEWFRCLRAGIASHHAGLVPPFKEAVEACFLEGLVKAVFATETLALGINMPARSVVIERLTKFTGETHEFLTPGQYTQLAGRAGRRGIDEIGHALVLWSPWVRFREVAKLAASREFVLRSSFRPTYNMAANLIRSHQPDEAFRLLNLSFAQFQADQEVVEIERTRTSLAGRIAELRRGVQEELPPETDLDSLLLEDRAERRARRRDVEAALRALAPGDVVTTGGAAVALLSLAQRGPYSQLRWVDAEGRVTTSHSTTITSPPVLIGSLSLPEPFVPTAPESQAAIARALRMEYGTVTPPGPAGTPPTRKIRHLRRLMGEMREAELHLAEAADSLGQRFARVLEVLEAWEYLEGWALNPRGERLARIYHECDLLVTECLDRGLFDDLAPAELAALVSCFTYERRSGEVPPPPWYPTRELRLRHTEVEAVHSELNELERQAGVPPTRAPDPSFVHLAHAWSAGADLDELLEEEELSGGDFVRTVKQLIDLTRQVAVVAPDPGTRRSAHAAGDLLLRGVVAASAFVRLD